MTTTLLILLLAGAAFYLGWRRALEKSEGKISRLHSKPGHYAWYVALLCAGPALALCGWLAAVRRSGAALDRREPAAGGRPRPSRRRCSTSSSTTCAAWRPGCRPTPSPTTRCAAAAELWRRLDGIGTVAFIVGALALAAAGIAIGLGRIEQTFRARNRVEGWVSAALLLTAAVSILTTAGIVFSVLFESIRFFEKVPIARLPVRPRVEPADRDPRGPDRRRRAASARCRCSLARC